MIKLIMQKALMGLSFFSDNKYTQKRQKFQFGIGYKRIKKVEKDIPILYNSGYIFLVGVCR